MKNITKHVSQKATPQRYPIPGREADMTTNYAGAYAFKADIWTRLQRFLIIGTEGGTYYASEKTVTLDNYQALKECVAEDGLRVIRTLVDISVSGRAPKNDQAIFALAYCLKYMGQGENDQEALAIRRAAVQAVNKVCRIGTHIFQLAEAVQAFGGWGVLTRRAVADWYNTRSVDQVAFQAVKYQNRERWSHTDLLRRSHVRHNMPPELEDRELREALYGWICPERPVSEKARSRPSFPRQWPWAIANAEEIVLQNIPLIEGFTKLRRETDSRAAANLIREYGLPREAVPTHFLNDVRIWEALFEKMPMTAMIRNLGKMSQIGLLDGMSVETSEVVSRLTNFDILRRARVHPINILVAMKTYGQGHGVKGSLTWTPVQRIVDALDDAFYGAFENIEPINKRVLIAIDKSGSMTYATSATVLTALEAAAVMAMVTVRKAQEYFVIGYDDTHRVLDISPKQRLDDVLRRLPHDGGGTDASVPARWAQSSKIAFDAICLYSDGESWAGHTHASQALDAYRKVSGINTLFCTCDTVANRTQLSDNLDARSMHCAGFDEQAPLLIQNFIKEN